MGRMFVQFSLNAVAVVNHRTISQPFSPQLAVSYFLRKRTRESPERTTRAFVREMMTIMKRQSVALLLKIL